MSGEQTDKSQGAGYMLLPMLGSHPSPAGLPLSPKDQVPSGHLENAEWNTCLSRYAELWTCRRWSICSAQHNSHQLLYWASGFDETLTVHLNHHRVHAFHTGRECRLACWCLPSPGWGRKRGCKSTAQAQVSLIHCWPPDRRAEVVLVQEQTMAWLSQHSESTKMRMFCWKQS